MRHRTSYSPQRLGVFTQKLLKPTFKKRGLREGKVITQWADIVGEKFAKLALAEKITFPFGKRSEGTLHLHVTSSGSLLLHYAQDMILEHVNTFFGYKAISKLRMTQGLVASPQTSPPEPLPPQTDPEDEAWVVKSVAKVEDNDLKACLGKLGESLCAKGSGYGLG